MFKKLLIAIIVIILIGLVWWAIDSQRKIYIPDFAPTATSTDPISQTNVGQLVANAAVVLPDFGAEFILKNGQADIPFAGSASGFARLGQVATTSLNGEPQAVAVLAINTGGTGVFNTLVLFTQEGDKLVGRSHFLIGDRITVRNISINPDSTIGFTVRVDVLDRSSDDAMAAEPTVPKTVIISVRNKQFDEKSLSIIETN